MTITEAFKRYNAVLKNIYWSVCAENPDRELVIRVWGHQFPKQYDNSIVYKDSISRWPGLGNDELRSALDKAKQTNQVIRVVIAHTENPKEVGAGHDAGKFKNTYSVREDWIGYLESWDGINFEINFCVSARRLSENSGRHEEKLF